MTFIVGFLLAAGLYAVLLKPLADPIKRADPAGAVPPVRRTGRPECADDHSVPVIDLSPWFAPVPTRTGGRRRAGRRGSAVRRLLSDHRAPGEPGGAGRRAGSRPPVLRSPEDAKNRYAVTVGGRGWLPPGVEANAYSEGTETPPD